MSSGEQSIGQPAPVFVGGTGRSGTTIAGKLIGRFPDIRLTRPREIRFTVATGGLIDAYETVTCGATSDGRHVSPQQAAEKIGGPWFERVKPSGFVGGISLAIEREPLQSALDLYLAAFPDDPAAATRTLTETIVGARVKPGRPRRWVDTTPANARRAHLLLEVFPQSRVVHMTRDGRDVAMSFVQQPFGPDNPSTALDQWTDRMEAALENEDSAGPGRILRLPLTALAQDDPRGSLELLAGFLGLQITDDVIAWLEAEVDPAKVAPGRWRRSCPPETARELDAQYTEALRRLTDRWPSPFASQV